VDDGHAVSERVAWAREANGAARELNRAIVRLLDPRENLSQRALAGAVLAADGVARPGFHFEADAVERGDAGKSLGDFGKRDRRHVGSTSSRDTSDRRR
jgi:hypothetical protein